MWKSKRCSVLNSGLIYSLEGSKARRLKGYYFTDKNPGNDWKLWKDRHLYTCSQVELGNIIVWKTVFWASKARRLKGCYFTFWHKPCRGLETKEGYVPIVLLPGRTGECSCLKNCVMREFILITLFTQNSGKSNFS